MAVDPDQAIACETFHAPEETELALLRETDRAYAIELSEAFEELVLLRQMGEYLELSDLSQSLHGLAEKILPLLKDRLRAECLLLIGEPATASLSPAAGPSEPAAIVSVGRLDQPDAWRNLVRDYRSAAREQAVVKNHLGDLPEGRLFPGVDRFMLVPVGIRDRLMGWLLAINRQKSAGSRQPVHPAGASQDEFGTAEAGLLNTTASILAAHMRNVELLQEKEEIFFCAIRALVSAIEAKDRYTRGHSERVGLFTKRLGEELRFDDPMCRRLYLSGLVHDVGKIAIQGATLRKPGRLTPEEFEEIQQHPQAAWDILYDLDRLQHVLPATLHHHESYDGTGYPDGLAGDEIPLEARILAVADTYDALTSDRPYRNGMTQDQAEEILRQGSGTQWDPRIIQAALRAMPDLIRIRQEFQPRRPPSRVARARRREKECSPRAVAGSLPTATGPPPSS